MTEIYVSISSLSLAQAVTQPFPASSRLRAGCFLDGRPRGLPGDALHGAGITQGGVVLQCWALRPPCAPVENSQVRVSGRKCWPEA